MFKIIPNKTTVVLLLSVLAILAQTLLLVSPQQASALTPDEQRRCYNTFAGKDITYTELSASEQALFNQCKSDGTCKDAGEGSVIGSRKISCALPSNASNPDAVVTASTAESAPLVKLFCGTKPSDVGSSTYIRYTDCANEVRTAYAKCKYTGGSITSSIVDTPENTQKCLSSKLASYKKSATSIQNAVKKGQSDSKAVLAAATDKQKCDDVGGAWDPSKNPPCDQVPPDTNDECPLPDDTSMRWLGCSIMSVVQVATDKLYGAIQNFLYTPTSMIFDNPSLKTASEGIRNLAIGLVLIAGLVMVIAQATGSDLVDAYTIRKLLPRIGVAIIGIALAWPLLRFAITFVNDLGLLADRILVGVTQLGVNGSGSENEIGTNIFSMIFAGGAAGGAILFLGAAGLVSLAGTILLALLIGLFVLAVRQLVIMVCVLLAPLAIAAYVLPGTQKLWSFWKNTLITTLLMFPIIMFFLASGKAFAAILGGADSTTTSLLAIIVFIAPYFLLPFAFKLAGGLMATIFSIANDRERGLFDRLKKGRQESVGNNVNRIRTGTRYAGGSDGNFRGKINRGLAHTANAPGAILASGSTFKPKTWGAATTGATSGRVMAEMEKNGKENMALQPWKNDDDVSRAAAESDNEQQLRANLVKYAPGRFQDDPNALNQAVSQVMTVKRQMSSQAFKAMTTLQAISGGTAYKNSGESNRAIAVAGMGDSALTASLVAQGRSMANNAGRYDQGGASFGTTLTEVSEMQDEILKTGTVSAQTVTESRDRMRKAIYQSQGASTLIHPSMKLTTIKELAPEMSGSVLENLTNESEFIRNLSSVNNVYESMKSTSPDKAQVIKENVTGKMINLAAVSPQIRQKLAIAVETVKKNNGGVEPAEITIQQAIEGMRGDKDFQLYGREYANQVDAQLGAQQQAQAEANAKAAAADANKPQNTLG